MTSVLKSLWSGTPKKNTESETPGTDTDSQPRGTKRKSKPDPYDVLSDSGGDIETQPIKRKASDSSNEPATSTPARSTPASAKRIAESRNMSHPSSLASLGSPQPKSRGRPRKSAISATRDAPTLVEQATAPDAARMQTNSFMAPVAPMGGLDLGDTILDAPQATIAVNQRPESQVKPTPGKEHRAKEVDAPARAEEEVVQDEDSETGLAPREKFSVSKLLKHKVATEGVSVNFLVQEVGQTEREAQWKPEAAVQDNAPEMLYQYWEDQGGRVEKLFGDKPGKYIVYKILGHNKSGARTRMKVQWVGHSEVDGEATMELLPKVKDLTEGTPILDNYWKSQSDDSRKPKRGRPPAVKKGTAKKVKK